MDDFNKFYTELNSNVEMGAARVFFNAGRSCQAIRDARLSDAPRLRDEEKAWREVASRVLVNVPSINVSYVVSEITPYDRCRHLFFKLNGRDIRCKIEDSYGLRMDEGIFKEIASKVTEEVMTSLLKASLSKVQEGTNGK